jgi:uncharacterized protein
MKGNIQPRGEGEMPGKVVHFEVPADDVERANNFYGKAFGWRIASWPGNEYHLVTTVETDENGMPLEPGGINGGMLKRQEPITSPVITIQVDDIESALKTVEQEGGAVVRGREPVGDMGFSAYFHDTEGNTVGLWENATPA